LSESGEEVNEYCLDIPVQSKQGALFAAIESAKVAIAFLGAGGEEDAIESAVRTKMVEESPVDGISLFSGLKEEDGASFCGIGPALTSAAIAVFEIRLTLLEEEK